MSNFIKIGKIVKPFGIKGEMKIDSESDFIEYRFQKGKSIFILLDEKYLEFKISSLRFNKDAVLITINELYNINQILKFINCDVYALKEDLPPLNEEEYYIDDLTNKKVYNQFGEYIGIVVDFIATKGNPLLMISLENKIYYIPFVDEFIKDIQEVITINEIEGLRWNLQF